MRLKTPFIKRYSADLMYHSLIFPLSLKKINSIILPVLNKKSIFVLQIMIIIK